ncbi:MAG: hypothetical protein WD226_09860 [Planctomycetota bacterium]
MEHTADFYNDRKFCESCSEYVPYLQSIEHSYCAACGSQVRLFSSEDWDSFHAQLAERRPKGGRRAKHSGKESA